MKIQMSKKEKSKKYVRGVALVLTTALLFTSMDLTVFATADKGAKTQDVITGFADLDESVAEQFLPAGAQESEIVFPDSLTVMLETNSVEESTEDVTQEVSIHVTWENNTADSFDSATLGNHYVYTPVIPDEYRAADGVSLPQISVTIAAIGGQEPADLLALLEKLPDPLTYLSTGVENKEIIDPEQLTEVREQLDAWLAENKTEDTENKETLSGEEDERLAELIARLEGLEHIRDTETDCMDLECPYHYPEMIQQRMAEDELPELLTLENLVEDYGVEPPEENAMPAAAWDTDQPLRASAKASALTPHPQTLMVTADNENNSHTGKADGDIDVSMGSSDKKHPIELAFTLDELPTQSAYLAVKAYDVDEDYGETDYVYLNDDIYLPMGQTNQFNKNYKIEALG